MPQCQFLFSAVFGSRKAVREIFSEFDETKTKHHNSPRRTRTPKGSQRGGLGPHTIGPRGPAPGRAGLWGGHPVAPPAPPLRLYKPFRPKNSIPIDETPERLQGRRRHRETPIRGTEVSVPAPCRDGEVPPEAISIDATASIMLRE